LHRIATTGGSGNKYGDTKVEEREKTVTRGDRNAAGVRSGRGGIISAVGPRAPEWGKTRGTQRIEKASLVWITRPWEG